MKQKMWRHFFVPFVPFVSKCVPCVPCGLFPAEIHVKNLCRVCQWCPDLFSHCSTAALLATTSLPALSTDSSCSQLVSPALPAPSRHHVLAIPLKIPFPGERHYFISNLKHDDITTKTNQTKTLLPNFDSTFGKFVLAPTFLR